METPSFDKGACRQVKQPLWDLEIDNETKHERVRRHAVAKSICAQCPIVAECLQWANQQWASTNQFRTSGVWGGRVYTAAEFKYPRCEVCDKPLATTMTAVYRISSGYALPHYCNLAVCTDCGVVLGLPATDNKSKLDGVRSIVGNTGMYRITSTVERRSTNRH